MHDRGAAKALPRFDQHASRPILVASKKQRAMMELPERFSGSGKAHENAPANQHCVVFAAADERMVSRSLSVSRQGRRVHQAGRRQPGGRSWS